MHPHPRDVAKALASSGARMALIGTLRLRGKAAPSDLTRPVSPSPPPLPAAAESPRSACLMMSSVRDALGVGVERRDQAMPQHRLGDGADVVGGRRAAGRAARPGPCRRGSGTGWRAARRPSAASSGTNFGTPGSRGRVARTRSAA